MTVNNKSKQVGVGVFARFRPCELSKHIRVSRLYDFEIMNGKSIALGHKQGHSAEHMFHLDMIFHDATDQQEMFKHVGEPIVRDVLLGYNGTILAYGQTGSGKTHSLFGDMTHPDSAERGIIPRACAQIFEHIQNADNIESVTMKCSFIEIYKEKLQDLLQPNGPKLKIRENMDSTIYVQGCYEEYVSSFTDVFNLLQVGFRNRHVASTLMNKCSSRSHCVLTLNIKQTMRGGTIKTSKVNFADLAGSEKVKKTGVSGDQLEEAKRINPSLSALGNVISALTLKKKAHHIPYRDSKLTFLLKDSLGGNTKTSLIVTCSSEVYNFEELVTTMRFAKRAKQMKNKVTINKQLSIKELQVIVQVYKQKLGVANATILRLQKLIVLMRSDSYNEIEYGPQIDDYLKELAKTNKAVLDAEDDGIMIRQLSQKKSKSKSKIVSPKAHLTPTPSREFAVERDEEKKEDEVSEEVSSLSSSDNPEQRADVEAIGVINDLNARLNAKDKEIDAMNEEINALRMNAYSQKQEMESLVIQNDKLIKEQTMNKNFNKNKEELVSEDDMAFIDVIIQNIIDDTIQQIPNEKDSKINQQMQINDTLKIEMEEVKQGRYELLLWNIELQKRLQSMNGNADVNEFVSRKEIEQMAHQYDHGKVSQTFEKQLAAFKNIQSLIEAEEYKEEIDSNDSSSTAQMSDYYRRAQQTALIMHNLQQKLHKLPEMKMEEQRDLIDAAVTSLGCLLDNSLCTGAELQNVETKSPRNSKQSEEIRELKAENMNLIKKLADMKTTWIAHLDMMMAPTILDSEYVDMDNNAVAMNVESESPTKKAKKKSRFRMKRHNKFVTPMNNDQKKGRSPKFGLKNLIGYLSGALLQYFGQVAVLRGSLFLCNKRISFVDFDISEDEWKKLYIVLTRTELLGYRSLLHAETDTKSPSFHVQLKNVISVLRIEEVLSAMIVHDEENEEERNNFDGRGMYVVTTVTDKYIFKAEGNLSREVWIDNIAELLKQVDSHGFRHSHVR